MTGEPPTLERIHNVTTTLEARHANAVEALRRIMDARDYHAEHGVYPPDWMADDQGFDDWAADIAATVLNQEPTP